MYDLWFTIYLFWLFCLIFGITNLFWSWYWPHDALYWSPYHFGPSRRLHPPCQRSHDAFHRLLHDSSGFAKEVPCLCCLCSICVSPWRPCCCSSSCCCCSCCSCCSQCCLKVFPPSSGQRSPDTRYRLFDNFGRVFWLSCRFCWCCCCWLWRCCYWQCCFTGWFSLVIFDGWFIIWIDCCCCCVVSWVCCCFAESCRNPSQ